MDGQFPVHPQETTVLCRSCRESETRGRGLDDDIVAALQSPSSVQACCASHTVPFNPDHPVSQMGRLRLEGAS